MLREYAAVLPDVALTNLAALARELVAADPEHERAQQLNELIDLVVSELWDRLQGRLARWRLRHQQPLTLAMFTKTLQGLSDAELSAYVQETRAEMLRSTDFFEKAHYRACLNICLSILRARTATQRMLSSDVRTRSETHPKGESWSREDG
jgi:cytochrome P450